MSRDLEAVGILAKNLERLLKQRKMSQRGLAALSEQPVMTIHTMVKGTHVPGIDVVAAVARALGVSIDSLLAAEKKSRRSA